MKKVLKKSDRETIKPLPLRLADMCSNSYTPALLEVDERIEALVNFDIEKVAAAQKAIVNAEGGNTSFRPAFHAKAGA